MLLSHHGILKTEVEFVPIDADVLLLMIKDNPTDYTKSGGGGWGAYGYRDIGYVIDSEIYNINTANHFHVSGFYDKSNGAAAAFANFQYGSLFFSGDNSAREYGVAKFSEAGIFSDTKRVKKIAGSAEYYINDVLKYTSLQNFTGGQFGVSIRNTGESIQNVNFKL